MVADAWSPKDAITGKAEVKTDLHLSAFSKTDQTAHLFSAAQIPDLRAALRESVVAGSLSELASAAWA